MAGSAIAALLARPKITVDELIEKIGEESLASVNLNLKARKRLLGLMKSASESPRSIQSVTTILKSLSSNNTLLGALIRDGTTLASVCDRILSLVASKQGQEKEKIEYLRILYELVSTTPNLKTQLCMSIHEYLLGLFEQYSETKALLSVAAELLVVTITHDQDNRRYFARHTSIDRLKAVFEFLKQTGDPLGQVFAAEFLWRVVTLMNLNPNEKVQIFGDHQSIFSIDTASFKAGIIEFIHKVNGSIGKIHHLRIKNLFFGRTQLTETHWVDVGEDAIVVWVNSAAVSKPAEVSLDLMVMKKGNIAGVGRLNGVWGVYLTENFDTLPQCFESESKRICFEPLDPNDEVFEVATKRFGVAQISSLPTPTSPITPKTPKSKRKSTLPPTTPTFTKRQSHQEERKTKPVSKDETESNDCSPTPNRKQIEPEETESDDDFFNSPPKTSKITKSPKTPRRTKSPTKSPRPKASPKQTPKKREDTQPRKPQTPEPKIKKAPIPVSDNSEDSDLQPESFTFEFSEPPDSFPIEPRKKKDPLPFTAQLAPLPSTSSRSYAPEKWELDIFDETKSFGLTVKGKLDDKRDSVMSSIEKSVADAIGDVTSFMEKCDYDLEQLKSSFVTTSEKISSDIVSKQGMVVELGKQQSEHIEQMAAECKHLQKRAADIIARFDQRKRALLANQEKHIALFREDLRSEVKTIVSNRKKESSKHNIQKLVSLLDGL